MLGWFIASFFLGIFAGVCLTISWAHSKGMPDKES